MCRYPPFALSPENNEYPERLWNHALPNKMQPIPVHVVPRKEDKINFPQDQCPRLKQLEQLETEAYKQLEKVLKDEGFLKEFAEKSGIPLKEVTLTKVQEYYDTIECDIFEGRKIPDWTESGPLALRLDFLHSFINLEKNSKTGEMLNLFVSNLFTELRDSLNACANGTNNMTRFKYYSAHDDQLNRILLGLNHSSWTTNITEFESPRGEYYHKNPPFASTIIFELFEERSGQHVIRILFNDQVVKLRGACNQQEYCTLAAFTETLNTRILPNFVESCKEQ